MNAANSIKVGDKVLLIGTERTGKVVQDSSFYLVPSNHVWVRWDGPIAPSELLAVTDLAIQRPSGAESIS